MIHQRVRDVTLVAVAEMQLEEGGNKKERRKKNKKGTQIAAEPEQEEERAGQSGFVQKDANSPDDGNVAVSGLENNISKSEVVNEGKVPGGRESEASDTEPQGSKKKKQKGKKQVAEHPEAQKSSNKADKSGKAKHDGEQKRGKNSKKQGVKAANVHMGLGPKDKAFIEECKTEARIGAGNDEDSSHSAVGLGTQQSHAHEEPQDAGRRIRKSAVPETRSDQNEVYRRRAHVEHVDGGNVNSEQQGGGIEDEAENQGSSTHVRAAVETSHGHGHDSMREGEDSIATPREAVGTPYSNAVKAKMQQVVSNMRGKIGMAKLKRIKKAVKQAMSASGQPLAQMEHDDDDGDEFA
jgi:hypothetical protein